MTIFKKTLISAVAMTVAIQPAQACWNQQAHNAVKIKHLTTMLMVTALRCRTEQSNFLAHYNKFVLKHNSLIGAQNALIRSNLRRTMGKRRAVSVSDNMSVGFANRYGNGHPTMNCAELSMFAQEMASQQRNIASLAGIVDTKLGQTGVPGRTCTVTIAARK